MFEPGISANSTITVMKYCVPKSLNQGVRSEPSETWTVWHSEEWSSSILSVKFTDTVYGDTVVCYRDNRGRSADTGPREQFVSIHPRIIQSNADLYSFQYSTTKVPIHQLAM